MEKGAFFVAVFQARAVQKQKLELCPGRIWELLESRLTQSFHFKLTSHWNSHIIVTGLYYLHQTTHWEPVLGEGRHAAVWETWSLEGRSLQRSPWGYLFGDWTMTLQLVEWCQQNPYELLQPALKPHGEMSLLWLYHVMLCSPQLLKKLCTPLVMMIKKVILWEKTTNKLILILSEKRNKPIFCCLLHQIIFITYTKSGVCSAKCIPLELSYQRELNSL